MSKLKLLTVILMVSGVVLTSLWLDMEADEKRGVELMSKAANAWSIDTNTIKSLGIQSMDGFVYVRRWEYQTAQQSGILDVTAVGGLVCHSVWNAVKKEYQNSGCLNYPE